MAMDPEFSSEEDRHFVFNAAQHLLKCFNRKGVLEWQFQARGAGQGDSSETNGNTPPGLYVVDRVEATPGDKAFGNYVIELNAVDLDKGGMRSGICIHGGGSALSDPLAPYQGWANTLGCIRVQNAVLGTIVNKVKGVQGKGGQVWVTVKWW